MGLDSGLGDLAPEPLVTFAKIKTLATCLPGVEETTSYGTLAFKVRGKLMARLKEDNDTLVARVDWVERERLLATCPEVFFLTEQDRSHPWILLRLSKTLPAQAKASLLHAWHEAAPLSLRRSAEDE